MPNSADFMVHVLMRRAAPATARAMFGGHGLYVGDVIVGIVINDVVYLKADDVNRGEFATQKLDAFVYVTKQGERIRTSYHRAPDDALETPATMAHWLRSAMGAALRSAAAKPARRKTSPQPVAPPKPGRKRKSVGARR